MPFPCGQTWTGSTRSGHSPSTRSIDWNRTDDAGSAVVAAAPGVVAKADATSRSRLRPPRGRRPPERRVHGLRPPRRRRRRRRPAGRPGRPARHRRGDRQRARHPPALRGEVRAGPSSRPGSPALPTRTAPRRRPTASTSPIAGNFVGDAAAEVGVYRRAKRSTFVVNDPAGAARVVPFGRSIDEPVVGDWDGDGASNVGIRVAKASKFKLQTPAGIRKVVFGIPSDRPVAGDWNGDGIGRGRRLPGLDRPLLPPRRRRHARSTSARRQRRPARHRATGTATGSPTSGVYDQATATFTLRLVDAKGQVWTAHGAARRAVGPAGRRRLGRQRDHRPRRLDARPPRPSCRAGPRR